MPQISHKLTAFNNGLRSNRIFSAPPTTSLIVTSTTNKMFKIQASFYPQQFDIISLITPIQLECPTRSFLSPFFRRNIPAQLPFLPPLPPWNGDAGRIVINSIDQMVSVLMCNGLAPFYRKSHSRGTHFQPLGHLSNRHAQLVDSPETE